MKFSRIYLGLMGAMTLCFGLIYLFAPQGMLDSAGFGAVAPGGITDVRATYGGLQIGIGAFLLWAAGDEGRVRTGLLFVAIAIGAVGTSRAIGLALDGEANSFHLSALPFEASITLLSLFLLSRLPEAAEAQAG